MSFSQIDYLSWYLPRIHGDDDPINLHASGMPALAAAEFPPAAGDPWQMVSRFEAALADWLVAPVDEVLFTPGATGGHLLALLDLARPGSQVLVEAPIYEPMLRQAERLNRIQRLVRRPDQDWRLPLTEIAGLLGDNTSVISITEPHNPSGVCSPREDVLELAERAAEVDAYLLVNEVYRGFGQDLPSYHGLADNLLVVDSLSKLLGSYWARLGCLRGPARLTERLRQAHCNIGMGSALAAALGLTLLERGDELRERARKSARDGLRLVNEWVEATPGLSWRPPDATGFGCVMLPEGIDDLAFADALHAERGVLVVPGRLFEVPGSIRLSWLQAGKRLGRGLEETAAALATQ